MGIVQCHCPRCWLILIRAIGVLWWEVSGGVVVVWVVTYLLFVIVVVAAVGVLVYIVYI